MSSKSANKSRVCRNIIIHGHCKFENSGCEYSHDMSNMQASSSSSPSRGSTTTPSATGISTSTYHTSMLTSVASTTSAGHSFAHPMAVQEFVPQTMQDTAGYVDPSVTGYDASGYGYYGADSLHVGMESMSLQGAGGVYDMGAGYTDKAHLDNYYSQPELLQDSNVITPPQPIQYHLYNTPLPHVSKLAEGYQSAHHFFVTDGIREEFQRKTEAISQIVDPMSAEAHKLPTDVHVYHTLFPLEKTSKDRVSKVFGYASSVYKATKTLDGKTYSLRRIEGFRLANEGAMLCIDAWRRIHHVGVVNVWEAFTTRAFAMVVAYDYHPLAETMYSKHFTRSSDAAATGVSESVLWSYICQLASALKAIHSQNLAARVIEPSKILVTGKNRIRINCCGILDMLTYDANTNIQHLQQDDLLNFGQLIIALACGSLASLHNLQKSIDYLSRYTSPDVKNVVLYLLSKPSSFKTIDDVISMISPRYMECLDESFGYTDVLENELSKSLENGRIARLMMKLGCINERPEFDLDATWSETGDRYLLKLFRDYVFHQVDETGAPLIDMPHMIATLNKLDAGIDEKIMLTSRDERSCLIVSFAELKRCLEATFQELASRSSKSYSNKLASLHYS